MPRQPIPRRVLQVTGLITLSFSFGCDITRSCTLIGCASGLYVQFATAPTKPFRVEVSNSGLGTTFVYECADVTRCLDRAIFQDYFPRTATVKVITASGSTTTNVSPEYVESLPNGKGCGPACSQATVTVPFPAG